MMDERGSGTLHFDGWVIRHRIPEGEGPFPLILLLHGWTGDENSMWVFASRFPKGAILVAPRGPYPTPLGGFGWQPIHTKVWPSMVDFQFSVQSLFYMLNQQYSPLADFTQLTLAGFSQGAALAYTMVIHEGEKIKALAALSGFMPLDAEENTFPGLLQGKPVFIAHGTLDDLVPIDRARLAVRILENAGAQVTYCEDEVGHKLSAGCFQGLEAFFQQNVRAAPRPL